MNYKETIDYIENTGKFAMNLGLDRIQRLCALMEMPQSKLKVIHIAGTNGKGSTTTFISSVLISQGYRVGIYTSPFLERFTERIKINDKEISEEEIVQLIIEMKPFIDRLQEEGLEHPTEFEIITAAAFKYFCDKSVDFVVLEVGLGGRYDATNVVSPLLGIITTISYDHIDILGDTLDKIAYEKAGIIKENIPVVVYPQKKEAMDVLMKVMKEKNAKPYFYEDIKFELISNTLEGIVFNVKGEDFYSNLKIKLLGEHQIHNALTAIKGIEVLKALGFKIDRSSIYKGLENAVWPGRFEVLATKPYIVLDGGHNLQCINAIVSAVKKYFDGKKVKIVCGMLRDKNYEEMIKSLTEISEDFITVAPNNPRALSAGELKEIIKKHGKNAVEAENIKASVILGMSNVKNDEVLLFCGSLYMIGEVRTFLKETNYN
jgi:dihydrofolate synthase / folylpolyglutamate synthase